MIKQKVDSDTYINSLKLGRDLVESSIIDGNTISPHANVGENLRKVIASHKDMIGLKQDLEEVLGCQVDLLTFNLLLDEEFDRAIKKESRVVYDLKSPCH